MSKINESIAVGVRRALTERAETYKIVRFFQNGDQEDIKSGLSLDDAKEHCNDPETSSRTATGDEAVKRTEERGAWFDGYVREFDAVDLEEVADAMNEE